jgi:hypothetical protein
MRYLVFLLLFAGSVFAQDETSIPQNVQSGSFYVDGIVYQYAVGKQYTVVAAARAVLNRKYLAIKVRVYNAGRHSVTVRPEDVSLQDSVGGHEVAAISTAELGKKLSKPYNMMRYSVGAGAGNDPQAPITADMANPQMLEMMRAIAARTNGNAMPGGKSLLYTDTPGALDSEDEPHRPVECDQPCQLRARETRGPDPLAQLQHQVSPDFAEQCGLLANTIPPQGNVAGIVYYPLGKLSESAAAGDHGKKGRAVRVNLTVGAESFQFDLAVE